MPYRAGAHAGGGNRPGRMQRKDPVPEQETRPRMLTIIVMSQKGGSGKSAVAAGLAVESMTERGVTFLIDIDPQCSAWKWSERRGQGSEPAVTATHAATLPRIRETCIEGGVERLIIDTPAGCGPSVTEAARVADVALIPIGPHQVELETLDATIEAAKLSGTPAAIVITRAETGHPDVDHARKYIRELDAALCPVVLHKRLIHANAYQRGRTAREQRPTSEAGLEMRQLEKWITKTYG